MKLESNIPLAAIGNLKITTSTWIKSSTAPAVNLNPADKYQAYPTQVIPIYRRFADKWGHYNVEIKVGGVLKSVYCFSTHAGIELFEDIDADKVGSSEHSIDKSNKKQIQSELVRIGLLDPPADGKWGSLSQSAWRAFKRVVNGDADDKIDASTLDQLAKFRSAKDLVFKPKVDDEEHRLAVKLIDRMVELNMPINVSMGSDKPTYNIVYVSGTNPDGSPNSDDLDGWNDLRFLIQVAQDGTVLVPLCKVATIDAGLYWRGSRRMNSGGAFAIDKDVYFANAWCVGRHGARQYPALVQVGEIQGTRDGGGDGRTDDDASVDGNFGINQHHGYGSEKVGINSAGCLVARSISGHAEFMKLLKRDRRYTCNNGYAWSTAVLGGENLAVQTKDIRL